MSNVLHKILQTIFFVENREPDSFQKGRVLKLNKKHLQNIILQHYICWLHKILQIIFYVKI